MAASAATNEGIILMGTAKMIGFLLAICGNTLIACSLTLQKSAHNSILGSSYNGNEHHDLNSHTDCNDHNNDDIATTNSSPRENVATAAREIDPESQLQLPPSAATVVPEAGDETFEMFAERSDINNHTSTNSSASESELALLRNPTWWMGTFLMAAGEIGNFAAFAFAPASLVAPLGAWSVVLSTILAHVFLHESVSNINLIGIALCVTGSFLIGTSGPDVSAVEAALDADAVTRLLIRLPFVVFMLLTLTATAGLIYVSHRTSLGQQYIFVYVGVSSLLGGVTVVCAKALSTFLRLTIEGNSQFGNLLPFALGIILGIAILAQLRYLNMAMAQFGNAQVIPVYYVLFTSCAMTSGVIMYREFDELTARNLPFFVGICSTMSGVFLVSKSARTEARSSLSSDMPRETIYRGKRSRTEAQYERVLPVSPMSSPRIHQQPAWS